VKTSFREPISDGPQLFWKISKIFLTVLSIQGSEVRRTIDGARSRTLVDMGRRNYDEFENAQNLRASEISSYSFHFENETPRARLRRGTEWRVKKRRKEKKRGKKKLSYFRKNSEKTGRSIQNYCISLMRSKGLSSLRRGKKIVKGG